MARPTLRGVLGAGLVVNSACVAVILVGTASADWQPRVSGTNAADRTARSELRAMVAAVESCAEGHKRIPAPLVGSGPTTLDLPCPGPTRTVTLASGHTATVERAGDGYVVQVWSDRGRAVYSYNSHADTMVGRPRHR